MVRSADTPLPTDGAAYEGSEVIATWGREHLQPVSFCGFDVGPFSMTVTVREGETPLDAQRRAMRWLDAMAREESKRKLTEFLARLRDADQTTRKAAQR